MSKASVPLDLTIFTEVFSLLSQLMFQEFERNDFKLSKIEILVLLIISADEGLTMTELAKHVGTSKVQISRSVTHLERADFVKRKHNQKNRRIVNVSLTENGKHFFEYKKEQVHNQLSAKLENFSPEDYELLMNQLKNIVELLRKYDVLRNR